MRSTINNVTNNFAGARYEVDKTSGDTLARAVTYYPVKTSLHLNNLFFLSYKKRNSPYINRFLQPDSVVPDPYNPQDLNRFSYVRNNPLRYVDPSGHMVQNEVDGGCSTPNCGLPVVPIVFTPVQRPNREPHEGVSTSNSTTTTVTTTVITPPIEAPYCDSSFLNCAANFTQDMATSIDLIFAVVEVELIAEGCSLAGPVGCGGGLLFSWEIFMIPNFVESGLSFASLVFTGVEDYQQDEEFGESTFTSLTTFLVGGLSPDPIADLVIDGYASGYNHGVFNGIDDVIMGAPLLQEP